MSKPTGIHSTAELARHLGLSRWSVSRAINGQGGISQETVRLVRETMAKFGFTPSMHARGLRNQRTGVIGICCRTLDTPVTIKKISRVQQLMGAYGFRPLLEITELDERLGSVVINHFVSLKVEAVLFVDTPVGARTTRWLRLLKEHGIPAAHMEPLGAISKNAVHLDRHTAMKSATEHMLSLGHVFFGLLGISVDSPMGKDRYDGIADALVARGLQPETHLEAIALPYERPAGLRLGQQIADKLLQSKRPPTALLTVNDDVATGVMWGLQKAGRSIPGDFSIFGFDNLPLSEQTSPALCTVDHQVDAAAASAVEILSKLIESGITAKLPAVMIAPKLIIRDSVGPTA